MTHNLAITSLLQLQNDYQKAIIYQCTAGSYAYGTVNTQSDIDLRGIYVLPAEAYLSVDVPIEQLSDDLHNEVYYALRRFIQLAAAANSNIIELLSRLQSTP
jgi:uncharacterized protein